MLTGLCPRCRVRMVLARVTVPKEKHKVHRIRRHDCGSRLEPLDVQPLPRLPVSRPTRETINARR